MKPTILLLLLFSNNGNALEMGSERFSTFMEGAPPYATLVDLGKDSSVTDNLAFTDTGFVGDIAAFPFPNGTGQKYQVANMMNFEGNYNWAAAKTDPRSSAFIMNSMDHLMADPNAEMQLGENLAASKLNAAQAGDLANKYIASEMISPKVGTYQTVDNQQSFESAYDNVLLGQAEEALFKGDKASAISYFSSKLADYKKNKDKQNSASTFQKDGMMRSKKTAETFRDFFQLKSMISQQNLAAMPTQQSLLNNCQANTPRNANTNAIYSVSMPSEEIQFYNLPPPSYNFDFCEQYIHNESSFLVRNEPVRNQLSGIIDQSNQMADGLDEISNKLSDQSLSVDQIAGVLSSSPAWKNLTERAAAYKECAKKDCLKIAEKAYGSMVRYPGYERHQSKQRRKMQDLLKTIKETGSMPGQVAKIVQKMASNKPRNKAIRSNHKLEIKRSSLPSGPEDNVASKESGIASQSLSGLSNRYKKRAYNDSIYYRDENGVLRGPSGKPIHGYHGSKDKNLFEIISRRYLIEVQNGVINAHHK